MSDHHTFDNLASRVDVDFQLSIEGSSSDCSVDALEFHEALSETFDCFLRATVVDGTPPDPDALLGSEAHVLISRGTTSRMIHGVIRHASSRDDLYQEGGQVSLHIVPALWLLSKTVRSRVFTDTTIPALVESIYLEHLGSRHRSVSNELTRTYAAHELLIQFDESDLTFIQRRLEQEGIFYYFRFEDEYETLVLCDSNSSLEAGASAEDGVVRWCNPQTPPPTGEGVFAARHFREIGTAEVSCIGYDWTSPRVQIGASIAADTDDSSGLYGRHQQHVAAVAMTGYKDGAFTDHDATHQARIGLEVLALRDRSWELRSLCVGLTPGHIIEVVGCPDGSLDGPYLVVACAAEGGRRGRHGSYSARLTVVPKSRQFRPPKRAPRPIVSGHQTARVVGPPNEEIYTDEHGRCRVRFHWDTDHDDAQHSKCSAWIRVMHSWSGAGFGSSFIPRVGMEVVVSFLDGDPDSPLIVGCVYNGDNRNGTEVPAKKTQSLIRTKSSPRSDGFNEMRFEDEAGNEFIYVHAEKDYNEEVEHDHSTHVKNNQSNTVDVDQTETVGNDQRMTVHNDRFHTVDHDEWVEVGHYRSEIVHGNEDWVIEGQRARTVKDDELLTVQDGHRKIHVQTGKDLETFDGGREVKVKEFDNLKVLDGANRNEHITGQYNVTVDGAHYTLVQGETEKFTQGSQKTYVESAKEVHAKTGSSHLLMKNDGKIKLAGDTKIELEVGACKIEMTTEKITLSAGSSSIELGPSGVTTSGSTVTSSAQTMNEITGLLVKIN
ncbi:MAG: type VI secretion system tip protein TssI/VgrG [Sandaracinaceae bacterium]